MLVEGVALLAVATLIAAVVFVWIRKDVPLRASAEEHWIRSTLRKVIGSFLSMSAGCVVGSVAILLLIGGWRDPRWFGSILFIVGMAALPVWLLVLIPLYVFVPRRSILWHPWLSTALGVAGGLAAMLVHALITGWAHEPEWLLLAVAALVGGVTCYYSAATANHFHGRS